MKTHVRRLSLVLIVVLLLGTFAVSVTAQADVARADTVIFDIDDSAVPNPHLFNPFVPSGGNLNQGAHQAMWEPLFILNYESGKIDPWLGVSFTPNSTQDVWTLKLHDGIKWSDGVPFTADDVVFTINLLLNDSTATLSHAADMQQWVTGVKKIDDLTVEFDLKTANPRFELDYFSVRTWGVLIIVPQHIWQGQDPATFTFYDESKGWPIGTGPYKLNTASPTSFTWDLDPNWWGAATGFQTLPVPKRLIWEITGSEDNKALLMSSHQLDSVMNITPGAFQAILAKNPAAVAWHSALPYSWADPCPRELTLNTAVAPWDDPNMRKAVSLMIDRNQIINVAYEGTSTASTTMFVQYGGMQPYIDAIVNAGYGIDPAAHVDQADALITAAGYAKDGNGIYAKDGNELSMAILTDNSTAEYTRTTDVLVEQFQAAGINATSQPITGATITAARIAGNFEAMYNWEQCGSCLLYTSPSPRDG